MKGTVSNSSTDDSNSQKMVDQLKVATVDVWIDEATSYVHQIDVKFALKADANTQTSASTSAGDPSALTMTADYSNFNKTVKIVAPKDVTTGTSVQAAILGQ